MENFKEEKILEEEKRTTINKSISDTYEKVVLKKSLLAITIN